MTATRHDHCRLILISPSGPDWHYLADQIISALDGGDIASLILWQGELGEADFQKLCEKTIPAAQTRNVAAIVADDTRIAGRTGADGVHCSDRSQLADLIDADENRQHIIGAGGAKNRHDALQLGEMRPDYLFFGRFGFDTKPDPHPRNLSLGQWWAELVEIPCVVMAGSTIGSLPEVAVTGAEFVAVSAAIFTAQSNPGEAVRQANRILHESAPRFEVVS